MLSCVIQNPVGRLNFHGQIAVRTLFAQHGRHQIAALVVMRRVGERFVARQARRDRDRRGTRS